MFYVFHGDEEFTRSEQIAELKARIVRDGMGDLNITTLDGRAVGLGKLVNACNVMPFLTERRLIIVEGLLQRFDPPTRSPEKSGPRASPDARDADYAQELGAYLTRLPPSTRLVFVESKPLNRANPILKQALQSANGYVREFRRLGDAELRDWVRRRARQKGTDITREAVALLVSSVGHDLRLLDQELEKLAAYVSYARPITDREVRILVSAAHEANVFALVDALGLRNRPRALQQLRELLDSGASELYILAMIARQVRLILSVKDLAEEKGLDRQTIRRELRISHSFILDKLLRQSPRFSMEELEALQRAILKSDQAIKTGRIEGELALELLVIQMSQPSRGVSAPAHQGKSRSRTR